MTSKPCKCENVQPVGGGIWQCILGDCRRTFAPVTRQASNLESMLRQDGLYRFAETVEQIGLEDQLAAANNTIAALEAKCRNCAFEEINDQGEAHSKDRYEPRGSKK